MSYSRFIVPVSLAFIAALAIGSSASAQGPAFGGNEKASVKIRYNDADIHSADGARRLALRIRVAADRVCGGGEVVAYSADSLKECRRGAIDRALSSLQAPMVAEALGRPMAVMADR
jgi:UrcA family protein